MGSTRFLHSIGRSFILVPGYGRIRWQNHPVRRLPRVPQHRADGRPGQEDCARDFYFTYQVRFIIYESSILFYVTFENTLLLLYIHFWLHMLTLIFLVCYWYIYRSPLVYRRDRESLPLEGAPGGKVKKGGYTDLA